MVSPSLDIIIGPMFAGKTTKLIEMYDSISKEFNCLAVNYALDNRYGENQIVSHDGLRLDCVCIDSLEELSDYKKNPELALKFLQAKYIFINEAQFFKGLKGWSLHVMDFMKKNLVMCGLDLDFRREPFGEINTLIPRATNVYKLYGQCNNCPRQSEYSHRKINSGDQVLIGSTNEYVPLCKKCYCKLNGINMILEDYIEKKAQEQNTRLLNQLSQTSEYTHFGYQSI